MPTTSTLEEKNSYCYFLQSDLGELCSKAYPLRLTICCCWTCSKPPVPEQDCRETCGKAALVSWHHWGSCGPTMPGAQPVNGDRLSCLGGQQLVAGLLVQGSPVAVLVLCWQQWSTGGVCGAAIGCPFTLEQSTTFPLLALPHGKKDWGLYTVIKVCFRASFPLLSITITCVRSAWLCKSLCLKPARGLTENWGMCSQVHDLIFGTTGFHPFPLLHPEESFMSFCMVHCYFSVFMMWSLILGHYLIYLHSSKGFDKVIIKILRLWSLA